jgi:hypothetical protein
MQACNPARLRLFVRSRRVPVGHTEFSKYAPIGAWAVSQSPTRAVRYERVLDAEQAKMVAEAKSLSCRAGLDLEVVDLGRMNALRRLFLS